MLSFSRFIVLFLWLGLCTLPAVDSEAQNLHETRTERTEQGEDTSESSHLVAALKVKTRKLPSRSIVISSAITSDTVTHNTFSSYNKMLIPHQHLYLRHRTFII
jgi:hypothetical protein